MSTDWSRNLGDLAARLGADAMPEAIRVERRSEKSAGLVVAGKRRNGRGAKGSCRVLQPQDVGTAD